MKKYMILFSVGKDRPGIVDDVSTLPFERGANIEDSRMAVMGRRFSIMTLFSCSVDQLENISAGLNDLGKLGLETSLHEAEDPIAMTTQAALPLSLRSCQWIILKLFKSWFISCTNTTSISNP